MKKYKSRAFGPILKQFRTGQSLTQEGLAEKVGVVTSYISMMESGQKFPSLEMLFELAEAMGVKASSLVDVMEQSLRTGGRPL